MSEAADSSSSSISESSTDTEMVLVVVCPILSGNREAEGRRRGGSETLDLTTSDFNKADCRPNAQICRKFGTASADWMTNRRWWRKQGAGTGGSAIVIHL